MDGAKAPSIRNPKRGSGESGGHENPMTSKTPGLPVLAPPTRTVRFGRISVVLELCECPDRMVTRRFGNALAIARMANPADKLTKCGRWVRAHGLLL